MNIDLMRELNTMIARGEHKALLSDKVIEIEGRALTEEDMIREELVHMSTVRIAERDVTLPGLGNKIHQELAIAVVAQCRKTWNRSYRPLWLAGVEDMTVVPLCRPEVLTPAGVAIATPVAPVTFPAGWNWRQTGHVVNTTAQIWPKGGAVGAKRPLDDRKERVVITDFVEMLPAPVITAIAIAADGDTFFIHEIRAATRISNLQMYKLPSPIMAKVNLDIDAKVEFAGDTELTPFGLYICTGDLIPVLRRTA